MPCLNLESGEPLINTLATMWIPEHEAKREAAIAKHWCGFYPTAERAGVLQLDRSDLLSTMNASVTAPADAEMADRKRQGMMVGETLKTVLAIAATNPEKASWKEAAEIVSWAAAEAGMRGVNRPAIYEARSRFGSVAHLWAAWVLRGQRNFCTEDALGDLHCFVAEAECLLQLAANQKLPRADAKPILDPVIAWRPPAGWDHPTVVMPIFQLPHQWIARIGKQPPKKPVSRK